jgi:beta-lactamase class A
MCLLIPIKIQKEMSENNFKGKNVLVYIVALVCLVSNAAIAQPTTSMTLSSLKKQVVTHFSTTPGTFALAFKNLDKPEEVLFINEKETFHAASTMKTPVMIEVYKQAAVGKFSLTDSIVVKNEFKSIVDGSPYSMDIADDSGEGLYRKIGKPMTIQALVYDMITYSSNLATNILIDLVDAKQVMQTMRELGANHIQVLRGVEDDKAYQKGLNNTTTAYDLLLIFEKLAQGKVVNQAASQQMIEVLLDQQFKDIIPMYLPKTVTVAHKTGSITGIAHDSGIVYLPDGKKYVLVLLSKGLKDDKQGKETMARISKMIYAYVSH